MNGSDYGRSALGLCATVALLSGCGALQPMGAPDAMQQDAGIAAPESAAAARTIGHRIIPASSYQVLHRFDGRDGSHPTAGLISVNGTLYGTAFSPGGVVYSISTTGKETVLHRFHGLDGARPYASLINVNGTLYGTTYAGGTNGEGSVLSITTTGRENVLYSFRGGSDGKNPAARLINVKGTLYGTTYWGGSGSCTGGCGTVFSIRTSGTEKLLHTFGGGSDGFHPDAGLINVTGTLYGTTLYGGSNGCINSQSCGTVFSITTTGTEKVLYSFAGGSDGEFPEASLINVNGTLYGTTYSGGANGHDGTVSALP